LLGEPAAIVTGMHFHIPRMNFCQVSFCLLSSLLPCGKTALNTWRAFPAIKQEDTDMTNKREYLVYVSGRANETRTYVWAERKADALFRIARHYGVKSTECDGSMVL
jgi:hypothetical protein